MLVVNKIVGVKGVDLFYLFYKYHCIVTKSNDWEVTFYMNDNVKQPHHSDVGSFNGYYCPFLVLKFTNNKENILSQYNI